MIHLPTLKTLAVAVLAATAFIAQPATAEARPKYKHGYNKHYKKHHRSYSRYHSRYHSRSRHWDRGRDAYYYGPRRHSYYGPRYYTPYRRSGLSFYLNL